MLDLDLVAQHSWAILLALVVLVIGVEFVFNRSEWKKRSAEVTLAFVGVFVAVIFALAQGKYDREQDGKDKALTLFKAAEVELSALMTEGDVGFTYSSKNVDKNASRAPMFEALMKEPEVLSRFPHHVLFLLAGDYRKISQAGVLMQEDFEEASYLLCALRTSIEIEEDFVSPEDNFGFWVEQLRTSCGKGEGLPNRGPRDGDYVTGLVDALVNGP